MNKTLDEATAIAKIKVKIAQIAELEGLPRSCPQFMKWYRETTVLLERIFGPNAHQANAFLAIEFTYHGMHRAGDTGPFERRYRSALQEAKAILTSIHEEIEEYGLSTGDPTAGNPIALIERITARFHAVARQLRARRAERPTLDVKDEYDAQDLLHALLRIFFQRRAS